MDYDELLDLTVDLAYQLQQCGAETYRVEETIVRLLGAYGVEGSAFSIPGCIIVSLETAEEKHTTRMHRAAYSSTDLDGIERYSGLCRRICQEKPPVQEAMAMIQAEKQATKSYRFPTLLMGYFLAAAGFSMFFRGTLLDALCAGLSGLATGLCLYFMNKLHANLFFKTVAAGFVLALLAHGLAIAGLAHNVDAAIIGALMLLVPGLLFTNSIRDIIYGDTMSGVNRLVQVLITAVALAVGTGAAVTLARQLWGDLAGSGALVQYGLFMQCFAGFVGSLGFYILLNLHGPGMFPCIAGSILSWLAYRLFGFLGMSDLTAFLLSAATISRLRRDHGPDSEMPCHLLSSGGPLPSGPRCRHLLHHGLCRPR
ncbi:MAG: threonine/serine exporter ThrE family protein [Oscillospiraceae bacterium]